MRCLCAAWRPLWPECVLQRDFEGFEELEEEAVVHEIVSLGNSMGLEVDDDDVEELVEEHSKELSTEELLELHKEENETLKRSLTSEESGEDEDKEESRIILAKDLKDAIICWSKLSKLVEDYHPDVGSVQKAISVFNDNVMNYFWKDMRYEAAIELLRKQVAVQSTSRLHQMLADFFSHVHDEEKAAHHFGIALNHEPSNTRALEGMQKMEAAPDTVEAPPYDMEVEDIADSEVKC
ncbi:Anaphase-promoting complex subunit 7-like [Homarus americanus]|uniref:Anaphase-promoting complex subunit 7-like n=1 Tax=Homarus americanus TaxID=6706 RepID=A0A8J5K023_HOMAM|nr:Anaphase-promoting complex subunit 7-like [Homarus americanus]